MNGLHYTLASEQRKQMAQVISEITEYYDAAEPPVRCGESHLSGLTEPPCFELYFYLA